MPHSTVNRPASFSIRADNIPINADSNYVVALFENAAGPVSSIEEKHDRNGSRWLRVTFPTATGAHAAVSLSGHLLGNSMIKVSPLNNSPSHPIFANAVATVADSRRNLYVLGLPLDLLEEEFAQIFSQHGSVVHAVIMATLDQFNRRRGFIVMSTHEEAYKAMISVSGSQLRGHQLHVSFAVVQRSAGFLDGEDRAFHFSKFPDCSRFTTDRRHVPERELTPQTNALHPSPSGSCSGYLPLQRPSPQFASMPHAQLQSVTLLATNICPVTFQNSLDLHALFARFGRVQDLTLMPASSAPSLETKTAIVRYDSIQSSVLAKTSLDGYLAGGFLIRVTYLQSPTSTCTLSPAFSSRLPCVVSSPLSFPAAIHPQHALTEGGFQIYH